MSQVTVRRPFNELDLCHQLGFKPNAVFHFLPGERMDSTFPLREVHKRACIDLQTLKALGYITAEARNKPVPHLLGVIELSILIIPDDQSIVDRVFPGNSVRYLRGGLVQEPRCE
jgi:hypothetical protein